MFAERMTDSLLADTLARNKEKWLDSGNVYTAEGSSQSRDDLKMAT